MVSRTDARRIPAQSGASYDLFDSKLVLKVTAADTDGAYSLVEYDTPPDLRGFPLHIHENTDEYIFVLEGTLHVVVDGQEIDAGPGEGVLFPRGAEHSFANTSRDRARYLTLLRPGGFEMLLAEVATLQMSDRWPPSLEEITAIFDRYDFEVTEHPN